MGRVASQVLEKAPEKILVVVIDYDDDLGRVGIDTPVIGVKKVSEVAFNYALEKPEDPDVNALFTAVKIYREMLDQGYRVEVAAISGDQRGGLRAVERIRNQLIDVINHTGSKSVIVVSDGGEDEKVIPVIESIVPIFYVKTIVIEQARAVEQTYILMWRYVKKILSEPRLSRLVIGYPGFLLILIGLMSLFNLLQQALVVSMIFLGIIMIIKGFNIEDALIKTWKRNPSGTILGAVGAMVMGIAIMLTWLSLAPASRLPQRDFKIAGYFLENFSWLYSLSIAVLLLGPLIRRILSRSIRAWRYAVLIVMVIMFTLLLRYIGLVLLSLPDTATVSDIINALWGSNTFQGLVMIVITVIIASFLLQMVEVTIARRKSDRQQQ